MNENEPPHPEIDEELMDLAEESTPSILRPLLMVGVILMAFWVINDWREELSYFFSDSSPVAVGDVLEFADSSKNPEWSPPIPHNRLVSLEGIPTQRSISSRYRYARLVGGWVFVEEKLPAEEAARFDRGEKDQGDADRTYFQGKGRAMEFSQVPGRYNGLRDYYRTRYGIEFCETLTPQAERALNARRRDIIREEWKREYSAASAEERISQSLTPQPLDEEVEEILKNNPLCQKAYLIQVDVQPKDHIWYVVASALFALFALVNLFLLVRWIRAFFR